MAVHGRGCSIYPPATQYSSVRQTPSVSVKLPQDVTDIVWRAPWAPVTSPQFEARLATEAGPRHVLFDRQVIAIGRRVDTDDVLFYLPKGPAMLAVVHLTFSPRTPEPDPRFPYTDLYHSVREWIDQRMIPDGHEFMHGDGPA